MLGYGGLDLQGEIADVMTIAVAPQARRRGHGARILAALLDLARADGAAHVMLEVRADNPGALALYERFGFARLSVRRRYYGDVDALVLRATLSDPADPQEQT